MGRALVNDFFAYFADGGHLHWLVQYVRKDHTLSLELRGTAVNVYYRGGSILKLRWDGHHVVADFDENYFRPGHMIDLPPDVADPAPWHVTIPQLKQAMDFWFARHQWFEREFQQLVVRENNFPGGVANATDYFMCDMEYADRNARFDLVGVRWPSTGTARKKRTGWPLVLIEVKYGDGTMGGPQGIVAHLEAMINFVGNHQRFQAFADDMVTVYRQKHQLGLMAGAHPLEGVIAEPEIMLLLVNHDPASQILGNELQAAMAEFQGHFDLARIRISKASCFGYGLFDDHTVSLPAFIEELP